MIPRQLGRTGLALSPIGYGAFKIGRNQKTKYPEQYDLPDETDVSRLLNALLDAGINYVDTAPAYGLSEERIGRAIAHRRAEFLLSTKVGETFADGHSHYDFSSPAINASLRHSLKRLRTDAVDILLIHSHGNDRQILEETDAVETLDRLKEAGLARAVGFSGKSVEGASRALGWADCLMVEYHLNDRSAESVIEEAAARGRGVLVKKGLASGHLDPDQAVRFVLANPNVCSLVVGGLNLEHMRADIAVAESLEDHDSDAFRAAG